MKTFRNTAFIAGIMLPALALGYEVLLPQTIDDDLYFQENVTFFVDDVVMPDDLMDDLASSSLEMVGVGSLTVASRKGGGLPQYVIVGGTTIESERDYRNVEEDDVDPLTRWWEGEMSEILSANKSGVPSDLEDDPTLGAIAFDDKGQHPDSYVDILSRYDLGYANEEFKFSQDILVRIPVEQPDYTKVWIARGEYPETSSSAVKHEWVIYEDEFYIVKDGVIEIETDYLGSILVVREYFDVCLRTKVKNGTVGAEPECKISCLRGYTVDSKMEICVPNGDETALNVVVGYDEDDYGDVLGELTNNLVVGADYVEQERDYRPGYFRFTDAAGQMAERDLEGLEGDDFFRNARINAATHSRKTTANAVVAENETSSVWSNLKELRSQLFERDNGLPSTPNVVTAHGEEAVVEVSEVAPAAPATGGDDMHSSAPLLPSTGPAGIFLGVAALGMGMMALGARRRK